MVVPRGTAARMDEDDGLAELEAALAMCLHAPPPSSVEPPTLKRPPASRPPDTITSPGAALPVFARQAPVLVTDEAPRPMVRTMVMAPAPAASSRARIAAPPPMPPGNTLTMNGPAPWMAQPIPTPPPMAALVQPPTPMAMPVPVRRSRVWLVALFLLAAFVAALASSPPLRVRTRAYAVAGGTVAARGATSLYQRARHYL